MLAPRCPAEGANHPSTQLLAASAATVLERASDCIEVVEGLPLEPPQPTTTSDPTATIAPNLENPDRPICLVCIAASRPGESKVHTRLVRLILPTARRS